MEASGIAIIVLKRRGVVGGMLALRFAPLPRRDLADCQDDLVGGATKGLMFFVMFG